MAKAVLDHVWEVVADGLGEGLGAFKVATYLWLLCFGCWHRIFLTMEVEWAVDPELV